MDGRVTNIELEMFGLLHQMLDVLRDIRTVLEATSHTGHDLGYVQPGCPGCVAQQVIRNREQATR